MSTKLPRQCPSCEGALEIERMCCPRCETRLEGQFHIPRLARLSREDRQFMELFVLVSGSLKTVSKRLGVSYPTVRKQLNRLVEVLEAEIGRDEEQRRRIIEDVEQRGLSARAAKEDLDSIK